MEPSWKDVLFLKEDCFHDHDRVCKYMESGTPFEEIIKNLINEELCGKYYSGFLKYFKHNRENCLENSTKNSQKSIESRMKGNELFTKGGHTKQIHEEIWKCYSKSISFAPIASEELALAYGNRSSLLLHFKKYDDCIKDIDRALAITKFDLLKVKLLCRKMSCLVALNSSASEKQILWENIDSCFKKIEQSPDDSKLKEMIEKANYGLLNSSKEESIEIMYKSKMPIVSNSNVNIICKKRYDISVKAAHDFGPGDVVFVKKPYVTSVNPNKFYAYCSHCLSFMWAGIPCNMCSINMYCSEKCKTEAWEKYHDIECKINMHINFDHMISYYFQTSIRAFIMGLKENGDFKKFIDAVQKLDKFDSSKKGSKSTEKICNTFANFYNLPYIDGIITICTLVQFTRNACLLLAYMTQTCDIFGKNVESLKGKALAKDKDFLFVGTLLVKFIMISHFNGRNVHGDHGEIVLCSKKHKNECECDLNRCCSRGIAIEPFGQLFAHDCNPNVGICYTDDNGKVIYYCIKAIKINEQLSLGKFGTYFNVDREDREFDMKEASHDICKCKACKEDWPELKLPTNIKIAMDTRRKEQAMEKFDKHEEAIRLFHDDNFYLNKEELQELATDTDIVLKAFGQPSFPSTYMLVVFCGAFEKLYGICPLESQLPSTC